MDNVLYDVMPKILTTALQTLREEAVGPLLVNSSYSVEAAKRGSVIDVPVPTRMTAQNVVPGAVSQATNDLEIDTVQIPLNQWKESAFALSDRDITNIMDGVPSMQVIEAARAIGNEVTRSIYSLYRGVYNTVGVAGTTPFGTDTRIATDARKFLNTHLAPTGDRRVILDVDAEANALNLEAFQRVDASGSDEVIREARMGRKFGFDFFYDQLIPLHDAGAVTQASAGGVQVKFVGGKAVNTTVIPDANLTVRNNPRQIHTLVVDNVGAGSFVNVGDVFSVAGDSQTYVVQANAAVAGAELTLQFSPAPRVAWADNAVVTFRGDHTVNLAFHRDAIALAVRSLDQDAFESELGGMTMTMQDPITRIPLRLEVRREYKRVRWSLDCLWGAGLVRPENVVRMMG